MVIKYTISVLITMPYNEIPSSCSAVCFVVNLCILAATDLHITHSAPPVIIWASFKSIKFSLSHTTCVRSSHPLWSGSGNEEKKTNAYEEMGNEMKQIDKTRLRIMPCISRAHCVFTFLFFCLYRSKFGYPVRVAT